MNVSISSNIMNLERFIVHIKVSLFRICLLTHLCQMNFPLLSIGPADFPFKGCCLVSFIFIKILLENFARMSHKKYGRLIWVKMISHYKKIGYNIYVLRRTASLVVNTITVGNFAVLFNCTPVGRTSDSMTVPTSRLIY